MELIWLATVAVLVSFLGYRLAQSYGLSGLTGLAISSAIYFVFVSDTWLQIYSWLRVGDNMLKALSGTVLVSCAILLAEKAKFLALFKLISLLAPITATSVTLPQYSSALVRGELGASNLTELWSSVAGSSTRPPVPKVVPRQAIQNDTVTLARTAPEASLYLLKKERLVESGTRIADGTWVLVISRVAGETGRAWVNVVLPTSRGNFVLGESPIGYVSQESIVEQVVVPAPR